MSMLRIFSILLFIVFSGTGAYEILAVFPHEGEARLAVFAPIVRKLIDQGHIVTLISHYSLNIKNATYNEVVLTGSNDMESQIRSIDDPYLKKSQHFHTYWKKSHVLLNKGLRSCEFMLSNGAVQKVIKWRTRKFDLILGEYFMGECVQGFQHKFGVPLVGLSSTPVMPWYLQLWLSPNNPSYIMNNPYEFYDDMGFYTRALNLLASWLFKWHHMSYLRENENLIEKYFNMMVPSITTNNNSLLLVNSQESVTFPKAFMPRLVHIGGVHINASQALPKDIQEFYDKFAYVVYVSMGSKLRGDTFPRMQRDFIIDACRQQKFGLLWKWDDEYTEDLQKHMMVKKWFPQNDILAHPKTAIFISQAGLLSVIEAIYYGVPMIAIPQFGDQFANAKELETIGIGVTINLDTVTRYGIGQAFSRLMTKEHRDAWKARQRVFKDRPLSPVDTAVYWIEYVARHKHSPEIKPFTDLPSYQYYLLDDRVLLTLIFLSVAVIMFFIIASCYQFCCDKKPQTNPKMKEQ